MKIFKHEQEKDTLFIIYLARVLFAGLIIFELLNFLKILQFNTQFTWLGLVITSIVSLVILEYIANKYIKVKGSYLHYSMWLIVWAALALDAFGDFFHWYGRFNWWDQFVHWFVSAVVCFVLFIGINAFWVDKFKFSLLMKTGRLKLSLLLAATSTMTLSAMYEVEEYVEDVIFHTNRLGPGADTANDLFLNLVGVLTAVVFVIIYYQVTHRRKVFK